MAGVASSPLMYLDKIIILLIYNIQHVDVPVELRRGDGVEGGAVGRDDVPDLKKMIIILIKKNNNRPHLVAGEAARDYWALVREI